MMACLLIFYINRGLFVAMPGTEIYNTQAVSSSEINSLLELIIGWAGWYNYIDEDGDSPESYNSAKTAQPLIDQSLMTFTELERPYVLTYKIFLLIEETMSSLYTYGTIDHPPELAS